MIARTWAQMTPAEIVADVSAMMSEMSRALTDEEWAAFQQACADYNKEMHEIMYGDGSGQGRGLLEAEPRLPCKLYTVRSEPPRLPPQPRKAWQAPWPRRW